MGKENVDKEHICDRITSNHKIARACYFLSMLSATVGHDVEERQTHDLICMEL